MVIPELLTCLDGTKIADRNQWEEKRRPEILELFCHELYGVSPKPERVTFEKGMDERGETVTVCADGFCFPAHIRVPEHAEKPVPVFVYPVLRSQEELIKKQEGTDVLPIPQILKRGYAAVYYYVQDIDPDEHDGFQNGVHGHYGKERQADSWGTISAWAWGASRVLDYIETDGRLDKNKVTVIGHSRGGKTALWAAAQDQRFYMAVSNNSGCSGAALSRGKQGETVRNINEGFPHWFCENYKNYNDREAEMPFDQHMLLALLAGRHVYVTSSLEDTWADPAAEFKSCKLALPAFALYGPVKEPPKEAVPLLFNAGPLCYHAKEGPHSLTSYDWNKVMDYLDKQA